MSEFVGIEHLRKKLAIKRSRVLLRYEYYDMKNRSRDPSPVLPAELKSAYFSCLGWCTKAVDSLADRLVFRGFSQDNFGLEEIYTLNNIDILPDSAILGALISGCDFIYISPDKESFPRLQVIDGSNATGVIDPITYFLKEGYAVLERSEKGTPMLEAYFTPGETTYIYRDGRKPDTRKYDVGYPLLVPVIYRPDATRPFGHARISRACMNLMNKARNTLTRADVSAEFYSFPQKYVVGTSPDNEPIDAWKATMSAMLEFSKDDEGEAPKLGQFTQQSMEPHISQFRMYASAFAGETGLTMDDLGFPTDNPSSADAIKASHESLRLTARKAQRTFGSCFLNAGFLAACLRDNFAYRREQLYLTKALWEPLFEPDASMLGAIGDGIGKINTAVPGYINKSTLRDLTGIDSSV